MKIKINETLKNFWLDILIFFAFVIDMNVHLTGLVIHEWLGLGLGVVMVIHLLFHWEWIVCTVKKLLKGGGLVQTEQRPTHVKDDGIVAEG